VPGEEREKGARDDGPAAEARFHEALDGFARFPRILASLGRCLAGQGRVGEALECLLASLEANPAQPALLLRAADLLALQGRLEEAERFYEHFVSLRPSSPRGYARMGDCLLRQGYVWSAADAYRKALDRSPDNRALEKRLRGVARLADLRRD
jgi:tetratricopeptide (TPR) repeat protein